MYFNTISSLSALKSFWDVLTWRLNFILQRNSDLSNIFLATARDLMLLLCAFIKVSFWLLIRAKILHLVVTSFSKLNMLN